MEGEILLEKSTGIQWMTWCCIQEDITLHDHRCENLRSYAVILYIFARLDFHQAASILLVAGLACLSTLKMTVCSPENWWTSTRLHVFIFQKIMVFLITAVRTSKPTSITTGSSCLQK
jgi:hypothetical protein